jgi:hypothetical protein
MKVMDENFNEEAHRIFKEIKSRQSFSALLICIDKAKINLKIIEGNSYSEKYDFIEATESFEIAESMCTEKDDAEKSSKLLIIKT